MAYNLDKDIFSAVVEQREDFTRNEIEIVSGLTFNQYETIKKIHKYYNSHYDISDYEDIDGVKRKKVFHNMGKWRCDVASKMIDLDVKDMQLISNNPESDLVVDILEKEFKAWMKKTSFGQILNQISHDLPIYGSVVLRKIKDGAQVVDLRNFFIEQAAPSIKDAAYVMIKHYMTPGQLRKKIGVWDGVETVIEKYCGNIPKDSYDDEKSSLPGVGSPYAEIWETWQEVPLNWFTGKESDENTYVDSHWILAGISPVYGEKKNDLIGYSGIVLFKEQITKRPFSEVHYNRTNGRWLGIGVIEDTFEAQRRKNKLEDQREKSLALSSLIAFQTRDYSVASNLINDVDDGDVIPVKSALERIPTELRNIPEFDRASQEIENLADRLTFSYDVIRGEATPSTATAFAVQTQLSQASSIFEYKRENIELFLNEFIPEFGFPDFKKAMKKSHPFRYSGSPEQVDNMREQILTIYLRGKILDFILKNLRVPTAQEVAGLKEVLTLEMKRRDGNKIWMTVVENFFKDADYNVDLVIGGGENRNIMTQLQNSQNILAMIVRYPDSMTNPVVRALIFQMMRGIGMNPAEVELLEQRQVEKIATAATPTPQPTPENVPTQ